MPFACPKIHFPNTALCVAPCLKMRQNSQNLGVFLSFLGVKTAPNGLKFCEQIADDERNPKMSCLQAEDA